MYHLKVARQISLHYNMYIRKLRISTPVLLTFLVQRSFEYLQIINGELCKADKDVCQGFQLLENNIRFTHSTIL